MIPVHSDAPNPIIKLVYLRLHLCQHERYICHRRVNQRKKTAFSRVNVLAPKRRLCKRASFKNSSGGECPGRFSPLLATLVIMQPLVTRPLWGLYPGLCVSIHSQPRLSLWKVQRCLHLPLYVLPPNTENKGHVAGSHTRAKPKWEAGGFDAYVWTQAIIFNYCFSFQFAQLRASWKEKRRGFSGVNNTSSQRSTPYNLYFSLSLSHVEGGKP